MNAGDRRRLYERAGILMVTRGMDPTQAIIEAARQLGIAGGVPSDRAPTKRRVGPVVEKELPG